MNQIDTNDLTQKALKQIRQLCNGNGIQSDAVQIASQDPEVITMEGLTHLEIDTKTHEEAHVGKFEKGKFRIKKFGNKIPIVYALKMCKGV